MTLGAMMLVDSPIPELQIPLATVLPAVIAMAIGTLLLVRLVLQAQRRPATTGEAGLRGARAVADTDLAPEGWVRLMGERWHALADTPVRQGEKVTITRVDGLTLRVKKED
jgi:membrane-bound serine protease (ClpP class)